MDADQIKRNRMTALAALRSADESKVRCSYVLTNGKGRFCALGYMGHAIGLRFRNSQAAFDRIKRSLGIPGNAPYDVTTEILGLNDRVRISWGKIADWLDHCWNMEEI